MSDPSRSLTFVRGQWLKRSPLQVLLHLASVCVVTACASTRSIPDFKYAVSAEYYECDFRPEPCPDKDTPHVSIDPERFRRAVATAVHLKGKTWSKGWSLVRVKLPDGREKDYRVPSFGQAAVDPPSESGTWIFEPGADQEFEELMGAARRTAR